MRGALVVVAVVTAAGAAYAATPVVLPALMALLMAMLVEPLVSRLEPRAGRGFSAFLGVMLAVLLVLGAGVGGSLAIAKVVKQVPEYSHELRSEGQRAMSKLSRLRKSARGLVPEEEPRGPGGEKAVPVVQADQGAGAAPVLLRGLGSILEAAALAVFVPFLALFLLVERGHLLGALRKAAGPGLDVERLREEVPRMARAYVMGNIVLGLVLAAVQFAAFAAAGLDNALGLGLVTGFLNVIPLLGLPLALALPLAQGLVSFDSSWQYFLVGGVVLALHLIAGNWIIPRTIGVRVRVNATAATLGMLLFSWLWGLVGFLMAVPLTAGFKLLLQSSRGCEKLGALLEAPVEKA